MYVAMAGATQNDRPAGIALLKFLPALPSALQLSGARQRQEVVTRQGAILEVPAA